MLERIEDLEAQVNATPDDYDLRLQLARAYEENSDLANALKQSDDAITIDPNRPEGHANAARLLYLASEQVVDRNTRTQLVAQALAGFDRGDPSGPDYADAYYFRAVLYAATNDVARSQVDLQYYLSKAPTGSVGRSGATAVGAGHDGARNTVDYGAPDPDHEEVVIMAQPPAYEIDDNQDLPGDHHHRPRHDRRRPRPEAGAEHRQPLRRARRARGSTTASRSTAWSPAS